MLRHHFEFLEVSYVYSEVEFPPKRAWVFFRLFFEIFFQSYKTSRNLNYKLLMKAGGRPRFETGLKRIKKSIKRTRNMIVRVNELV